MRFFHIPSLSSVIKTLVVKPIVKPIKNNIKGKFGEIVISGILNFKLSDQYAIINNVTLPTKDDRTTQIDHIIVSPFGVFVIETKNRKGWIFGSERQKTWTQVLYREKNTFQNPLLQNYKHTQVLSNILNISKNKIFSIIVFTGDCTFKTEMPENVMHGEQVANYINSKNDIIFTETEIEIIKNKISNNMLERSFTTNANHIRNVQEIISSTKSNNRR